MQTLFINYDGDSPCPTYTGEIGSMIKDGLVLEDTVKFKKVPGFVVDYSDDKKFVLSLNNDMKLLLDYCLAAQNGVISPQLANRIPGKVHKAR